MPPVIMAYGAVMLPMAHSGGVWKQWWKEAGVYGPGEAGAKGGDNSQSSGIYRQKGRHRRRPPSDRQQETQHIGMPRHGRRVAEVVPPSNPPVPGSCPGVHLAHVHLPSLKPSPA